ncbi:MAG: hypothetical protein H7Z72_08245 [Bacteroidetes bacterium]|nr:hypothetical protein [Fibrella sp.]
MAITLLISCRQDGPSVTASTDTPTCDTNQNYAKTPAEAAQRVVGEWKLRNIIGGYILSPPPVPDQTIVFSQDGSCVITEDGQRSGSFMYKVGTIQNFVGTGLLLPSLTVSDTTQTTPDRIRIGGPVAMFVCDNQLILDYGRPVDAGAYVYQKTK